MTNLTAPPRPPKPKFDWRQALDQAEGVIKELTRLAKVIAQGVALVGAIGGTLFTILTYGGKVVRYLSIGAKAMIRAHEQAGKSKVTTDNQDSDVQNEDDDNETSNDDPANFQRNYKFVIDSRPKYTRLTQPGDELNRLACACDMSPEEIVEENPEIDDPDLIIAGETKVHLKGKRYHRVKKGQILKVVAKMYKVTVPELMEANGKRKNYSKRGEILIIPNHIPKRRHTVQ